MVDPALEQDYEVALRTLTRMWRRVVPPPKRPPHALEQNYLIEFPPRHVRSTADRYDESVMLVLTYGREPSWVYPGVIGRTKMWLVCANGQVTDYCDSNIVAVRAALLSNVDVLREHERGNAPTRFTYEEVTYAVDALYSRIKSYTRDAASHGVHNPPRLVPMLERVIQRRRQGDPLLPYVPRT